MASDEIVRTAASALIAEIRTQAGLGETDPAFLDPLPSDERIVYMAVARAVFAAVEPLIRAEYGECSCDPNPSTTNGPEEDCPQHGRPYSYWTNAVGELVAREPLIREQIAKEIERHYLGPDSGRSPLDGRDAPDAHLRNAYDEGLEEAARIARGQYE